MPWGKCVISIDRRLVPGEAPGEAVAEVEAVLEALRRRHPRLDVRSVLPAAEDPPLDGTCTARITRGRASGVRGGCRDRAIQGCALRHRRAPAQARGIDRVVLGPGSADQAHTIDEFVELEEVEKAVEIYRRIMLAY